MTTGGVRVTIHVIVHGVVSGPVAALTARASRLCIPSPSPEIVRVDVVELKRMDDDDNSDVAFLQAAAPSSRTSRVSRVAFHTDAMEIVVVDAEVTRLESSSTIVSVPLFEVPTSLPFAPVVVEV